MASAEGWSVPNGVGYGEGGPLQPTRRSGERHELPQRCPGRAPAENGLWRILKATERSFLYLYDKNLRGTICTSVPYSKFWGTCPPPPVIYANVHMNCKLLQYSCLKEHKHLMVCDAGSTDRKQPINPVKDQTVLASRSEFISRSVHVGTYLYM